MFAPRNVASMVVYTGLSALAISWTFFEVLIPMLTTPFALDFPYLVNLGFQILIVGLMFVWGIYNGIDLINRATKPSVAKGKATIVRLTLNQRVQHIWLVVTVAILALTGFAQLDYESWGRLIVVPMGGLQVNMDLHLVAAFFLGILAAYHLAFHSAEYITRRVLGLPSRLAIMQGKQDLFDMVNHFKHLVGRGEQPRFGKYSFVQKYDYWGIYWGMVVLGLPGLIMWSYGYSFLGGLPFIFHTDEAVLAVLWVGVTHLYHTHFNPASFPMSKVFLTGKVSEGGMKEEHPLELERLRGVKR